VLAATIPLVCQFNDDICFIIGGDGPKRIVLEEMRERHQVGEVERNVYRCQSSALLVARPSTIAGQCTSPSSGTGFESGPCFSQL